MEINHISAAASEKGCDTKSVARDNFPDSSIGEGMDITIQGANGHVKSHNDTQSLRSHSSLQQQINNMDLTLPPGDEKMKYSDMSIGIGMDLSIRGDGGGEGACKDSYEDNINGGWAPTTAGGLEDKKGKPGSLLFDENGVGVDKDYKDNAGDVDRVSFVEEQLDIKKDVKEVLHDPVDDVVVEDCCPQVCYRLCPCCIGDPDSPFWQLWWRHRLQVSRCRNTYFKFTINY